MDRDPVKGTADVTEGAIRDTARKVTGDKVAGRSQIRQGARFSTQRCGRHEGRGA
jgi:hypothetical protein